LFAAAADFHTSKISLAAIVVTSAGALYWGI